MDFAVNTKTMFAQNTYARLACNLNRDAIASLEELSSADGKTIFRVSFEGENNTREYDLSLPVVGKVMDLNRMIKIVFYAVIFLAAALMVLIILLITRFVRKRKKRTIS